MPWYLNVAIVLGTFCFMEFMAWFTHKFVMHGFLWRLHKDHHVAEPGFFEKNDAFFLIFAVPSFLLFLLGAQNSFDFKIYIGLGILLYGICYLLVHDIFIHQRFKIFRNSDHPYFRAIRKAHKVHHKHLGKERGECFGMLLVPFKFWREALRSQVKTKV
ncbi:MAG: beta-carotene 3-hydroxylase [Candidatus Azotimanducaceae bacterium]|jgi:beta-carotene 3-hydroxylase